ncbi:MAG: hypothetical protein Q9204_005242 [Flavoplaca sp. TL-2023a]
MPNNDEDAQATILKLQKQLEEAHAKAHNVEAEAKAGNNAHVSDYDTYQTSLTGRYCSAEISRLFSQRSRHSTWRKLWLYLAEAERELGIHSITPEALEQMRSHLVLIDADFEVAKVEEKARKHDVMAHVHAFGVSSPAAAGIIHYGDLVNSKSLTLRSSKATSCYVTDNTELILIRDAMDLLLPKLARVILNLAKFSVEWKGEPCLAYTHLQPGMSFGTSLLSPE